MNTKITDRIWLQFSTLKSRIIVCKILLNSYAEMSGNLILVLPSVT